MRKSTRTRLAGAGLTAGAVAAAVLVAPTAAYAAGTPTPPIVAAGGSVQIVDPLANMPTTVVAEVQTAACNNRYTTPGATATTSPFAVSSPTRTSATTMSITVPAGATAGTNGAVKLYYVCVYDTTNTSTSVLQTSAAIGVGTLPTVSPAIGPAGGGNTLNITTSTNVFSGVTTVGGVFATGVCPATLGTPAANLTTTVTRTSDTAVSLTVPAGVTSTTAAPTPYNVCLYSGNTSAGTILSFVPYSATQIVLSQTSGPSAGGNGLNITSPTSVFAGVVTLNASFTSNATCGSTYDGTPNSTTNIPVAASNIRRLANNRIAITVPALSVANYQLCLYNGTALLATAPYAGTTVQDATAVTPKAGPALGGNVITISGTSFPTAAGSITATLGGTPLTGITPLTATAFTAIAPAHSPMPNAALVINTASGQSVLSNAYSFLNAIEVAPNTAPNTAATVDVIVKGIGFQSATWNSGDLTGAHVYLVDGVYNSSDAGSSARANPPVAECTNVLAFSDTELVCSLQLNRRLNAAGTAFFAAPAPRTASVVTVNGNRVITGTFTAQDVGLTISDNTSIPASTTITQVLSTTQAIISNNAVASGTDASTTIGMPLLRTNVAVGVTQGDDDITAASSTFTNADIGRRIIGAEIPNNTVIVSIANGGAGARLSNSVSATTNASATVDLFAASLPVAEGAYTLTYVTNGSLNAATTDDSYSQSVVSSGSTFTVAPF